MEKTFLGLTDIPLKLLKWIKHLRHNSNLFGLWLRYVVVRWRLKTYIWIIDYIFLLKLMRILRRKCQTKSKNPSQNLRNFTAWNTVRQQEWDLQKRNDEIKDLSITDLNDVTLDRTIDVNEPLSLHIVLFIFL